MSGPPYHPGNPHPWDDPRQYGRDFNGPVHGPVPGVYPQDFASDFEYQRRLQEEDMFVQGHAPIPQNQRFEGLDFPTEEEKQRRSAYEYVSETLPEFTLAELRVETETGMFRDEPGLDKYEEFARGIMREVTKVIEDRVRRHREGLPPKFRTGIARALDYDISGFVGKEVGTPLLDGEYFVYNSQSRTYEIYIDEDDD